MAGTNFSMSQGADFDVTVALKNPDTNNTPMNLTGYTGTAMMRRSPTSTPYAFTVSFPTPATDGNLRLVMSASTTATVSVSPTPYYRYDVLISNGSKTLSVLEGIVTVNPGFTHN